MHNPYRDTDIRRIKAKCVHAPRHARAYASIKIRISHAIIDETSIIKNVT